MNFYKVKQVVIITEAVIFDDVIKTIIKHDVKGYTVTECTGKGGRNVRSDSWLIGVLKNIKIEIITSEEIAKKIATEMVEKFFKNYAGIVYLQDVEIIRTDKFQIA